MSYSKKFIENSLIYIKIASTVAEFSKANRRKVGAIIVSSEGKIIGTGFNGTPSGVSNVCEDVDNVTYEHVIHAEINAIFNATTHKLDGSTIFVTTSPCMGCASAILQKKIKTVIYEEPYRDLSGVEFLIRHGVDVISTLELRSMQNNENC